MQYHTAHVTITGKVFVSEEDLLDRISEKYPDLIDPTLCTPEQEREAFEELAQEKISAMFPTDDPMKHNETTIDMSSYRHS